MNENPHIALLREVSFFAELNAPALELLAQHVRRRSLPAGEALFHEGDPGHTLYVIASGRVTIQSVTASGSLVFVASRARGETVGEMSLVDGKPRMADAVTAEPTSLLMLDRADFLRCLEESPRLALGIIASLADRLREAADQLKRLQSQDVLGRLCAAILARLGPLVTPGPTGAWELPGAFSQQQMAEEIGTTRESVNRALARLRQLRAVQVEGRRLVVLDLRPLRRYRDQ